MCVLQGSAEYSRGGVQQAAVSAISHAAWPSSPCLGRSHAECARHAGLPGLALQPHRLAAVPRAGLGQPPARGTRRHLSPIPLHGVPPPPPPLALPCVGLSNVNGRMSINECFSANHDGSLQLMV